MFTSNICRPPQTPHTRHTHTHRQQKALLIICGHLTSYCAASGLVKDYNYHFPVCIIFHLQCFQCRITPLVPRSPSLPPSLSYTQRPKVQAHHLLIRQKECNEIINVPELIMNMIKKAKISGAGLSLPIHSQGLLSLREGEPKKPSSRAHSGSVLRPACLSCCLCCCGRLSAPSNRAATCSQTAFLLCVCCCDAVKGGQLHHGLSCLHEFLSKLRGLDPPKNSCGK